MSKRVFTQLFVSTAGVALAMPALAAAPQAGEPKAAASASVDTGDIIVTARRRDESMQSVPVAVSAVSGEALNKAAVVNLQDITRLAPSISIGGTSRGGSIPSLSIRGIAASDSSAASDPAIGIYVDDVIQQRPNGVLTSVYDVSSVQVLRGPQGTLFGRNTIGGAVLINSAAPTDHVEVSARGRFGNYNYLSGEGMLNLPISDAVQLRIAGRVDKRDGYVTSITNGQDYGNLNNQGARISLKIGNGPLSTTTIGSYYNSDTNGTPATTPGLMPPGAVAPPTTINANSNIGDAASRALIASAGALRNTDFYKNANNEFQFEHTRTYSITNTTKYEANDQISLKNIIAYRFVRSSNRFDSDGSAARWVVNEVSAEFNQFSEELQATGDFGPASVTVGAYVFQESGTEFSQTTGLIPFAQINDPASTSINGGYVRNKSYSGFASVGYKLTDQLTLNGGIRYTWDKRFINLQNFGITKPLSNPVRTCTIGAVTSITQTTGPTGNPIDLYNVVNDPTKPCSLTRGVSFQDPSWSVDLNWKPTNDLLLYIAHRHGYHSGALNSRAAFFVANDYAKPEYLDDIEIGLKSNFDMGGIRTRFNVAGYYGWYKDVQRQISLPTILLSTNGGTPVTRTISSLQNASKAHIYGLEVEYGATIEGFSLNAFAAYNRTKYDSYLDSLATPPVNRVNDLFPFAPQFTAGVTGRYEFSVAGVTDAALQLNYFHSSSFNTLTNLQPIYSIIPAYDLVNARVEANNIGGSGIDAAFFVNNLTKTKYFTGSTAVPSFGAAVQIVGAPRMYGIELSYKFGN